MKLSPDIIFRAARVPRPVAEYRFAQSLGRRWCFDFAWPDQKIALEVEGGMFGCGKKCPLCGRRRVGAHTSIERLFTDMEKYNCAAVMGWRVLRCTPTQLRRGSIIPVLTQAFGRKEATP